jgi:hypothetical protein
MQICYGRVLHGPPSPVPHILCSAEIIVPAGVGLAQRPTPEPEDSERDGLTRVGGPAHVRGCVVRN